jgi:hypothetical protein
VELPFLEVAQKGQVSSKTNTIVVFSFNYEGAVQPQYIPDMTHRESQKLQACQGQIHRDILLRSAFAKIPYSTPSLSEDILERLQI